MRYDAFISYRHTPLDMEIAKKVHAGLETYRIPGPVQKKTGKKKMGRVFRDQEELPIGSDLDDNISQALRGSEYLIVICSPRTPDSYWVCKEIETFIGLHDRNHVLAVLIEGEPDESFPPQLLKDEKGNPVEPLAADVRGNDTRERNSKFKTELLRLAAPVIGCTYDDLKQRHRERMIRRTVTIVSSAAAVIAVAGTAFGIYNANIADRMKRLADEKAQLAEEKTKLADDKTRLAEEISVQFQGKQVNQSRFYAEEALSLLKSGNREDAVLVALEGLPSADEDRPYVPEAEYALGKALYAYDFGNNLSFERNLTHSLAVSYMNTTSDRSRLVSIDNGSKVYVWNTKDWSLDVMIEPGVNSSNYYDHVESADADDTGVYVATQNTLTKYDYDGKVIFSVDSDDNIRQCLACTDSRLILVCRRSVSIMDADSGKSVNTFNNDTDMDYTDGGRYYPDRDVFVTGMFGTDVSHAYVSAFDIKNGTVTTMSTSDGYCLDHFYTVNGNHAVLSCNPDVSVEGVTHLIADLFDGSGTKKWSKELDIRTGNPITFVAKIKGHKYSEGGTDVSDIVVTADAAAFTIDEFTGDFIASFNLAGDATMLALSSGNSYGRVGYKQGNIDFVDFRNGRIHSEYTIDTGDSVREAAIFEDGIVFDSYSSPDAHIMTWHEAPDIEDYMVTDRRMVAKAISEDAGYFALYPSEEYTNLNFYNADGKELYIFDKGDFPLKAELRKDRAYVQDKDGIWVIDPFKGSEELIRLSDLKFDSFSYDIYFVPGQDIAAVWSGQKIKVIDLVSRKVLFDLETESVVGGALLSGDGKTLYVMEGGNELAAYDTRTNERKAFEDTGLRVVASSYDNSFMTISRDGRYIAICCLDGYIRVVDTDSLKTYAKVPLPTYQFSFVSFTDDGTHLVMQGDDYRIRIWNVQGKSFVNTVDAEATVNYIVCDEDSSLMAVCLGDEVLLYEMGSYGCVADAVNGLMYFKSNDSILLSYDGQEIKRTYHKDYKKLIEEASVQFPDASLDDEKRVKYNIN